MTLLVNKLVVLGETESGHATDLIGLSPQVSYRFYVTFIAVCNISNFFLNVLIIEYIIVINKNSTVICKITKSARYFVDYLHTANKM